MNWLVSAALFAASIILLLMRRIGRDAGARADTRYFQRVGWVFSTGLLLLAVGLLAGLAPRHPFILLAGMGSSFLSVYLLALFAYSFPHSVPAPASLRLSLGALTAGLIAMSTQTHIIGRFGPVVMSGAMLPYFALTLYFVRRNWKAATAPGRSIPSLPVTIVQTAVVAPWIASFVGFALVGPYMPHPIPTWVYLLQALCMSMVIVGGVAVAILRYHLFEIRVLLREAVLAVLATGAFAVFVGVAAEPLHEHLTTTVSHGFAALVIAGVPPLLVHAAMSLLDRWTDAPPTGSRSAAAERALLEQTLAATGRLVEPGAVLELVASALREASGGEIRFLQNQPLIEAQDSPPAVLLAAARERAEPFWSAEHHPELPSALSGWMTAERVALVVPVRRDEMLFGFVVVSGVDALPRARTVLCVRLCEHLALKLQNFVLYADAALAARELADYRAFLENLVESLPVGVATVAPDLKVRSWNRAMETHTGVDRARALASGCFDQLFPHLQRDLTARDAIAATQRDPSSVIAQVAVETPGPQGIQYHDLLFAAFRDSHGEPRGAVVISDDVTQRVRLAEELEESRRLASLGAFAAALAHDIRTPLTSIQMNVQILSSRVELGESDREYLDIAQEEISRLTRSVGEILEYARPLALNHAAEDIGDFVDDLARSVATLYAERGVRVEVVRELDGECVIPVDLARLRRAMLNLLDNAVDASPRDAAVTLRVRSDSECVRLSVEDRGRGIPADTLSRVFDPFFTTRPDGTGLGLAIARNVVRAHGGQVEVASEPERGTTFTVTLPRARAEQAPPPSRLSDPFGPNRDDALLGEPAAL